MTIPRLLAAFILAFVTFATSAFAQTTTRFICLKEDAANAIAAEVAMSDGDGSKAGQIAEPYMKSGGCLLLPTDLEIDITYKGKIFKGAVIKVQVVGFKVDDHTMFYALFPLEDLSVTRESGPAI